MAGTGKRTNAAKAVKKASAVVPTRSVPESTQKKVQAVLSLLEEKSTQHDYENLARFGITANNAFGVSMANMKAIAKRFGRDHELAAALWDTGFYEARMLTSFIDDPALVTPAQMDRWCRDFDNWAICDTLCFHLFDRSPHAWAKVIKWSDHREEFVKRTAFALLACLALHDKKAADKLFLESLPLIERAATDERNFVKKAVSWALRAVGRRNTDLNAAAAAIARRLTESAKPASRWVGKDAFRELTSPVVTRQLANGRKVKKGRNSHE